MAWRRLNGIHIIEDIVSEVEGCILKELAKGNRLKICVGTDSEVFGDKVSFATVIVFVREGKGGFMLIQKSTEGTFGSIKERMMKEVELSVMTAYNISEIVHSYDIGMEVHADINEDGKYASNVAMKEAIGYIRGMGFDFKVKPSAFASSSCADRML